MERGCAVRLTGPGVWRTHRCNINMYLRYVLNTHTNQVQAGFVLSLKLARLHRYVCSACHKRIRRVVPEYKTTRNSNSNTANCQLCQA